MAKLSLKSSDHDSDFPRRLRELRVNKNLTQEELGEIVGVHANHLGRYERGLTIPSTDTLTRLAEALNVSPEYLLRGNTEKAFRTEFTDAELMEMFQEIENLPDEEKDPLKKVIRGYLNNSRIRSMTAK